MTDEKRLTWVRPQLLSQSFDLHVGDENGKIIATQKSIFRGADIEIDGNSWVMRPTWLLSSDMELKHAASNEILAWVIKPLFGHHRLEVKGQSDVLYLHSGTDLMHWRTANQQQVMRFQRRGGLLKSLMFEVTLYPSPEWTPYWSILACTGLHTILREIAPE